MSGDAALLRLLLDEHYPARLADALSEAGVDTVALSAHRPELRGADDIAVLTLARSEGRVVVTEDVTTFAVAAATVGDQLGIVYCHHSRFPRTGNGLERLRRALVRLAQAPPAGLGSDPIEWWLPA